MHGVQPDKLGRTTLVVVFLVSGLPIPGIRFYTVVCRIARVYCMGNMAFGMDDGKTKKTYLGVMMTSDLNIARTEQHFTKD